jgi:hypothetical protein
LEVWIPLTLFAALAQSVRSALQKHLTAVIAWLLLREPGQMTAIFGQWRIASSSA